MSGDQFLGEIRPFAGAAAPKDWVLCDGTLLMISENTALYSLIGTTYGGDGRYQFAVPDLRGRVPIGAGAAYPLGRSDGQEQVRLNANQMPIHAHDLQGNPAAADVAAPTGAVPATTSSFDLYVDDAPGAKMASDSIGNAGYGLPHDNVQPYLCINYMIAVVGVYPSRP